MLDYSRLYPEEVLVAYASRLLEEAGSNLVVDTAVWANDEYVTVMALDVNGKNVRLIAPVIEFQPGIISFRSILEATEYQPEWTAEGKSAGGCNEVYFYGDQGPKLISSVDTLADFFRSGTAGKRQDPAGYRGYMESLLQERLSTKFYNNDFDIAYAEGHRVTLHQQPLFQVAM